MNFFQKRIARQIEKDKEYRVKNKLGKINRDEGHTIGDFIGAVFSINNETEASLFYQGYLEWLKNVPAKGKSKEFTDEEVAKRNIGWCFGEGMSEKKIEMWNRVVGAIHPVFGSKVPTFEEAFEAGKKLAREKQK